MVKCNSKPKKQSVYEKKDNYYKLIASNTSSTKSPRQKIKKHRNHKKGIKSHDSPNLGTHDVESSEGNDCVFNELVTRTHEESKLADCLEDSTAKNKKHIKVMDDSVINKTYCVMNKHLKPKKNQYKIKFNNQIK